MTRWFLLTGLTKLSPVRCYFIKCLGNPCESKLAEAYNPTFYVHSIGYEPILIIPDGCSSNSSTRRRSGESTTNILSRQLSSSTRIWVHNRHPLKSTLFFKKIWVHYKPPLNATLFCFQEDLSPLQISSQGHSLLLSSSLFFFLYTESNITACHEQASKENWKSWEGETEAWDWPVDPYHMSCICSPRKDVVLFVISICSSAHQQGMRKASKRKKAASERQREPYNLR